MFRVESRFYLGMSLALLGLALIGFAPSFYLAPLFNGPPLRSAWVALHGLVLTAWLVLLVVQIGLVGTRRTETHRKLGIAGAAVAILVVASSLIAQINRTRAVAPAQFENLLLPLTLVAAVAFTGFVGTAIALRRRPADHKRLMVLGTITLIGAASVRLPGAQGPLAPVLILGPSYALISAIVVNDLITGKRLERATIWGAPLAAVATLLPPALAFSGAVAPLARWIAG